ncbi:four-carbon acid sugar kinase family protein [Rhizobium sp. Leaf341]|uniref:four-carbon acid sugar kinase family protein n=1 Tax=Rhizobium sp. Leaf341 TaxID=1736344 RepID=UPI00071601D7|nr:four-carbon acid sugar kinase family protein [Rhizobium sp. Leaf341]KQR68936.1 Hrp-dependent type III effector protein [Rhizobium sp. Leaf341]
MLVILADDLTGTLDAAAPFAARGLRVEVALVPAAISDALSEGPDVLSINVQSREVGAEAAQAATRAVLAALPDDVVLFKKVDSRLKGHIAAELDAMPFRRALMAPAIPDFGRLAVNGHVRGFGVDVPIPIADRLGVHAGRARIPDTADAAQMRAALEAALAEGVDLLIGARGLAEALAVRMTGDAAPKAATIPAGPGLFVIGSRDPITLAQIAHLRTGHAPAYLAAPNGRVPSDGAEDPFLTLVQAVPGEMPISSLDVARHLADGVYPDRVRKASTLVLSGGATAEAVLAHMGIHRFRLLGECMPGLGVAFADGHCIIAKSGGFGGAETLSEIAAQMVRNGG